MDLLDSRLIKHGDCFAQKFAHPGKVSYQLAPVSGMCLPAETTFTLEVAEAGGESQQHTVEVRQQGRDLVADPPHLKLGAGDMVLWHSPAPLAAGFVVYGSGADINFSSADLSQEAVFTHAFGTAGTYAWRDANGSEVQGVVEVVSPDTRSQADCEKWLKALADGSLVHVVRGKAKPERVQVLAGQTVVWAIESAPGITITDTRLLDETGPQTSPSEGPRAT